MTFAEMKSAVQRNLGRVGVATAEGTDVGRFINQTIRERICARHNWSGMEVTFDTSITTTASDDSYAWPTPTRHKDALWIEIRQTSSDEWQRLKEEDQDVLFDGRCYSNLNEGLPIAWARGGDSFYLRPIPDASTYPVRIKQLLYPADLSGDSDTNFVTLYWTNLLEVGATARAALYYGENELAQQHQQAFEVLLQEAIVIDRQNLAAADMVMRPSLRAGRKESGRNVSRFGSRFWVGGLYDWY